MLSRVAAVVGVGEEYRCIFAAENAVIEQIRDRGTLLIEDETHHQSAALIGASMLKCWLASRQAMQRFQQFPR